MAAVPALEDDALLRWLRARKHSLSSATEFLEQLLLDITARGANFFDIRHESTSSTTDSPFHCSCGGILYRPITQRDGVSRCSWCVQEQERKRSRLVGMNGGEKMEVPVVNVLLARLVSKCYGNSWSVGSRKSDSNQTRESDTEPLPLASGDSITRVRREESKSLYSKALDDTDTALVASPQQCKTHYQKAQILDGIGGMEESLASCLTCLVLKEDAVLRQHTARMLNQYLFAQAGKPESDIWVQKLHKVLHLCLKELSTKPVLHMDGLQGRLVLEDFDCSLCCRLLYKPVTTPCGHVFCLSCLNRSLDHRSSCPTCRGSLVEYLSSVLGRSQPVTVEVERMIQLFFSDEYKTREQIYTQELQQLAGPPLGSLPVKADIPVIVCGPAFPSVPSCLHIFEPCYRLMLRRCLESNANQFGMCQPSGQSQLARIGTMLTVRGVQYLADGRSMVSTVGGKRFRVLSYGMLDGYGRAVVQFFSDEKVVSKPELTMLRALSVQVRGATENWFRSLSAVIKDRILSCYGELPSFDPSSDLQANDDGPDWVWWVCAVLQGQGQACDLLGLTLLRDRLLFLQQLLDEHASLIRICRPQ